MGDRITRGMKRRLARQAGTETETKAQPHRDRKGRGPGYEVLDPTKGWKGVSFLRVQAGRIIAAIYEHGLSRMRPKKPAVPKDTYRYQKRQAPQAWPGTETRQQTRRATRIADKATQRAEAKKAVANRR